MRQNNVSLPPRHMTIYVGGGYEDDAPVHHLWKDGRLIIIQSPPSFVDENSEDVLCGNLFSSFAVEIIQTLLDTIEFGKTNWGYLIQGPEGYRIVQKKRTLNTIYCPVWAPLICEDEIEVTRWHLDGTRRGRWNDRNVDVLCGYDNMRIRMLNVATIGARAVQGLDVTFEILGHLVDSEGNIVGLVSEAAWGRQVQLKDRFLVYETISKIQQRGILFAGISSGGLLIANGKLRLATLHTIYYYFPEQRDALEQEAEVVHWAELDELFLQLEELQMPYIPPSIFLPSAPIFVMPKLSAPTRPIVLTLAYFGIGAFGDETDEWKETEDGEVHTIFSPKPKADVAGAVKGLGETWKCRVVTFSGISSTSVRRSVSPAPQTSRRYRGPQRTSTSPKSGKTLQFKPYRRKTPTLSRGVWHNANDDASEEEPSRFEEIS